MLQRCKGHSARLNPTSWFKRCIRTSNAYWGVELQMRVTRRFARLCCDSNRFFEPLPHAFKVVTCSTYCPQVACVSQVCMHHTWTSFSDKHSCKAECCACTECEILNPLTRFDGRATGQPASYRPRARGRSSLCCEISLFEWRRQT